MPQQQGLTSILTANGSPWLPDTSQLQRMLALSGYSYEDASYASQSGANWWTYLRSADQDILPERKTLISRSRNLTRNNPIARGTKRLYLQNVVGKGLIPRPQLDMDILGLTKEEKRLAESALLSEFSFFADDVHCDVQRENNFYGLQSLAYGEAFEGGDCLIVLPLLERPGNPFATKIQIVEAEQVDSDDVFLEMPGSKTVAGVHKDANGAPVGYQYREPDAGEFAPRKEVPAFGAETGRRISWLMKSPDRVRQTRGVPYLASIMATIHDLGHLQKAELLSSIVHGMLTLFVTSPPGQDVNLVKAIAGQLGASTGVPQQQDISMGYATGIKLNPGQDIKLATAGHPNVNFAPYFSSQLDLAAMGLGMPAEVFRRKFEASYSASRAAVVDAFEGFSIERILMLVQHFCQPIWETAIWESVFRGRLRLKGFLNDARMRKAWLACQWRGSPRKSIDPLKEVLAAKERIELRISSHEIEVAEFSGQDWEDVHEQLVTENERAKEDGLLPETGPTVPVATVNPAQILKDQTAQEAIASE